MDPDLVLQQCDPDPRFSFTACPHLVCNNTHENDTHKTENDIGDENHNETQNDYEKHRNDSGLHYPSPPPTASPPSRSVPLPTPACPSTQNPSDESYHFGGILDSPVVLLKRASSSSSSSCPCAPSTQVWTPLPQVGITVCPLPLSPPPTIPTPTHALPPTSLLLPIPEDDDTAPGAGARDERRSQLLSPLSPEWASNRSAESDGNDVRDGRAADDVEVGAGDSVLMAQDDLLSARDGDDEDVGRRRPALHPLDIPISAAMFPGKTGDALMQHDDDGVLLGFAGRGVGSMPPHQFQDATMQMRPSSPLSLSSFDSASTSPTSACSAGSFSSFASGSGWGSPSSGSELELEMDDDLDLGMGVGVGHPEMGMDVDDDAPSPPSPVPSLYALPDDNGYSAPLSYPSYSSWESGPSSYHSPALRALPLLAPPPKAKTTAVRPHPYYTQHDYSPRSEHEYGGDDGGEEEEQELDPLDLDMELGLGFGMSASPSPRRRAVARLPDDDDELELAPSFSFGGGSGFDFGERDEAPVEVDPAPLWGQQQDADVAPSGSTDGDGNALHLELPLPLPPSAKAPPPSILDAYTPAELGALLPPSPGSVEARAGMEAELTGLLAVRARARVALALASASASTSAASNTAPATSGSSASSSSTTATVLDHELRRTVPRDAGEPRRRRKRAKELGREVDALVGLRLGILPVPTPNAVSVADPAFAEEEPGTPKPQTQQKEPAQQEKERQQQKQQPNNIRRDKAGLAGLASVPQLVARMILRRRERCVRGLDAGKGRGRGASPLRVAVVEDEDEGEGADDDEDVEMVGV
ncbi:hypothetical protein C8R46DRAFT_1026507 [Mycena filopes]|nr:hypothetical protein C8R46DRAFT_1026507 [Mycena filopes]